MSSKTRPVVFVTLLLSVLSGEVLGEAPQQSEKPTPGPIPGISRMNPYYLGISAAVLANDTKALSDYVNELEKVASSHPETWMDAMCARLYVLEKLDDRDRFSQAMAQLCARKLPEKRSAERRLKFVTTTLLTLRLNHKTEWVEHASDAIWPVLGPEPDPLLARILRDRLGRMPHYPEKAKLLADALSKATSSLQETPSNHPLQAYWTSGLEELYYLSVKNHFSAVKIDPLSSEVAAYLDKFGKDGRHAAEVFYLLLKALNVYYTQLTTFATTLSNPPNPEWLQHWQQTFTARKEGTWAAKISEEWAKWERGAQSRDELAHQPRKNPKLQVRLSLKLANPKIIDFLSRLSTASGLRFTVADNIPEDRVVCESLSMHEVQAWSVMDQIKQAVVSEGQWEPEIRDHRVTGYKLTGNLKPLPSPVRPSSEGSSNVDLRYLLVAIPLLAVWGIRLLIRRRRQAHAASGPQPAPKLPSLA